MERMQEKFDQTATPDPTVYGIDYIKAIRQNIDDAKGVMNELQNQETATGKIYERKELLSENIMIAEVPRADGIVKATGEESNITEKPGLWPGDISLQKRVESGELSEERVDGAFSKLKNYFVRSYRSARIRCVDGRPIEGYPENREQMRKRELGPQGAGGTPGAALSFLLAEGHGSDKYSETARFSKDMGTFASDLNKLGFEVGGHTDDHESHEKTGCGAIDRMPEIIRNMTNPDNISRLDELTQAVMGDMYDTEVFSSVLGNATRMNAVSQTYFSDYKQSVLNKLQDYTKNAVSKLVGQHKETAAIVNRIYGYTFHRDEFSADNNDEIQAFSYDYWKSVEMAESLFFKSDRYQDLSFDRKIELSKRMITARVMYTVATLMTLTDGSIKLFVVDEKDENGQPVKLGHYLNTNSTPTSE